MAMMIAGSRSVGRWFGAGGENLDPMILTGLMLIALFIIHKRKVGWAWIVQDNIWLVLLFGYALMSIIWSEIPFTSFKRWVRLTGGFVIAVVVLSEEDPMHAVESIFRRCAYVLLPFSLVLIKYFPHLGRDYGRWSGLTMWTGVTTQKNSLAALCVISIIILLMALLREKKNGTLYKNKLQNFSDIFVIGLALFLVFGAGDSYSATSSGILAVGVAILLFLRNREGLTRSLAGKLKVFVVLFCAAYLLLYDMILSFILPMLGRDETFTGRTEIWAALIEYGSRTPILGAGYGGFYDPGNRELEAYFSTNFILAQAHSGYLAVWVELGYVGIAFLTFFLLSYCTKVHRMVEHSKEWAICGICFLPMSILYNYTEVGFIQSGNYLWSTIIILTVVFSACSKPIENATINSVLTVKNSA